MMSEMTAKKPPWLDGCPVPLPLAFHAALRQNRGVNSAERTPWVLERANALGFDLCGVAPVEDYEDLARIPEWLASGRAGEMLYLHDMRRRSPTRVLEGARNVIVCALNYNSPRPYSTNTMPNPERGWISRYAWGDDYHDVLGEKLEALVAAMRAEFPAPFEARAYVDTGPIVERVAAKHAGLGWLAKNTCLINPELGLWLFLGVILTTLELAPSLAPAESPPADLCGNCTLCVEACPTGAIVEPYVLDARRCISYLTIELRGSIPQELREPMGRHVFGCDICQDVCPYNRQASTTSETAFVPRQVPATVPAESCDREQSLFNTSLEGLASLDELQFRELFRGSAIKRTKWQGLVRNACVALGNSGVSPAEPAYPRLLALLERLAASADRVIGEHARWAMALLHD
jgi:epoxyqueuosine reductase